MPVLVDYTDSGCRSDFNPLFDETMYLDGASLVHCSAFVLVDYTDCGYEI